MRIEDYALIGDCQTAALVGRNGSIDWLCWPRFDSAACFAALLGGPENGYWKIAPAEGTFAVSRRYLPDTLILETEFETAEGAVTLLDFMPVRSLQSDLVRIVVGKRGRVAMESEGVLRFDYGASVPWVTLSDGGKALRAVAGPDLALLCSPVPLENAERKTRARFEVSAGETFAFVLTYTSSHLEISHKVEPQKALEETEAFWKRWSARCSIGGEWAGAGAALADHAQGAHLCADRRHRRRADHLAAGAASAACATGTIATAGCATRRSRCSR